MGVRLDRRDPQNPVAAAGSGAGPPAAGPPRAGPPGADSPTVDEVLADPGRMAKLAALEARDLGERLLDRLARTEPGTRPHSELRGCLVALNMPLVRYAAGRYRRRAEPMEDIVQVGTIGLIKAIDRYDGGRETGFLAYAMPTISGEIKRFFRDTSWAVRVPRRLRELRAELMRANDKLTADLGHAPCAAQLAKVLNLTEGEVTEGLTACSAYNASSLDESAFGDGASIGERMGGEDRELELVEYRESLRPLIADLPQRERTILALRFTGDMTQAQIGERLGISQMHVSRLLTHTLSVLREGLTGRESYAM
ncbi:SigB/SigF/SigG family RNA polymerase sigma factor [Streptomyces sp. SID3343]|uniref:SigB/SigF/SigG family RNA polymerase sigma factor n=1 Tax=Streptomyces sp. SID3343 TaxID=2690260 RepID=UPI001372137C|nr:SigB/SigF/SigG family RNA polymerase sigma factor [Streptomyces sp. SID3343]MYW05699.1 SigB/SigF/SigG family RNA polymerase sigma factor [Streptomyces sp. SID3343]